MKFLTAVKFPGIFKTSHEHYNILKTAVVYTNVMHYD